MKSEFKFCTVQQLIDTVRVYSGTAGWRRYRNHVETASSWALSNWFYSQRTAGAIPPPCVYMRLSARGNLNTAERIFTKFYISEFDKNLSTGFSFG